MSTNENPLENLEFFDTFSSDDPIDTIESYDPNKNIAPDILGGQQEIKDPVLDPEDEEDDLPKARQEAPAQVEESEELPDESEDSEEYEDDDIIDEDDSDDDVNYFEVFGKGLAKAGILEFEENENPENLDWSEETFLKKMNDSIEKKAWDTLEEIAMETYGEDGVKMVEDIFINKVPIHEYLKMFNNEQVVDNIDLNNPGNQERVFRLYLAKTGMEEDEIEDQLNYARDNDRLFSYAKKYHSKLVTKMKQERDLLAQENAARVQQAQMKERERQEQYAKVLEDSISKGEIEGYPINQNSASELFDFVLSKPHVLPNGQRISDFEYSLAKMRQEEPSKFLAVAKLVQTGLDLTPVKKKGVSEETNSIFNELKTKTKKTAKRKKSDDDLFSKYFK